MGDKTGRTWPDIIFALPRYVVVFLLVLIVIMIVRAEFSQGITKYGFLGDWGRKLPPSPTADDAIIGANARLNRQLQCVKRSMNGLSNRVADWKEFVELTGETKSNDSLRQSRTAIWKTEVDEVLGHLQATQQCLSE
ncbi:MAG: hypothetical protein HWE23_14090 [Rhodobacteraceae bacterium]|nr:hypothetical protein [Paracoccaceae bacterium]